MSSLLLSLGAKLGRVTTKRLTACWVWGRIKGYLYKSILTYLNMSLCNRKLQIMNGFKPCRITSIKPIYAGIAITTAKNHLDQALHVFLCEMPDKQLFFHFIIHCGIYVAFDCMQASDLKPASLSAFLPGALRSVSAFQEPSGSD